MLIILALIVSYKLCCLEESETSSFDEHEKITYIQLVEEINDKSLSWIDTLDVDPINLSYEMGINGKKKFVELLDIYLCLYQRTADPLEKEEYKQKVEELASVTKDQRYHDLDEIDDTQFRQNSTSYLRAWYILNEIGINTTYYIEEIEKILPRLNDHLPGRGINQKMAFVFYYHKLGYSIEYTMKELLDKSTIRKYNDAQNLSKLDVYFITHEIFFLHDDDQMNLLIDEDIEYLRSTLKILVNKTILDEDVDLLAEILMIMTYLDFDKLFEYDKTLDYILNSQNKNGSFGYYEDARRYYESIGSKIDVDIYLYLHTTEVVFRALNEAVYIK